MRMDFSALKVVFRLRVLPQNPNSRFQNQNPDSLKLRTQIFLKTCLLSDWPRLALNPVS